jgi:hypothetical protein
LNQFPEAFPRTAQGHLTKKQIDTLDELCARLVEKN